MCWITAVSVKVKDCLEVEESLQGIAQVENKYWTGDKRLKH